VLRPDFLCRVVEGDEVAGFHVHGPDAQTGAAGVEEIKIDQFKERGAQRSGVVMADRIDRARRQQHGMGNARLEKVRGSEQQDFERPDLVDGAMIIVSDREHPEGGRGVERRVADRLPERAQSLDPTPGRITRDQGRIDRPDRNSCDPLGMNSSFGKGLVDAGLIGSQCSAALQQQRNALEGGPIPAS
jgi:hypothetical protein